MESAAKVAIVTGASSGIGEATAKHLAGAGYRTVLAARRADLLEGLAREIGAVGGVALAVPTDLSDEAQTHHLIEATMEAFGRVDLLVNNAGYSPVGALEQLTRQQVRDTFEVNLFGGLQLIAELAPVMRAQGGGRVVNVSSLTSRFPAPLTVPYAGTKGGIEGATNCLRLELAPWNIKFSVVIPGFVDTPAFETARESGEGLRSDPDNMYRQLMLDLDEFATRQLESAATPDQVAEVILGAARAKRPREYYLVPFSSGVIDKILRFLPWRWIDRLLIKLYMIPA